MHLRLLIDWSLSWRREYHWN